MIKLRRDNTFDNLVVFIDGQCNSGKEKISRVLECFEGVEKSKEDEIFYCIHKLHELNKIDTDTAITLLKTIRDKILYYQMVGRDINFRINDITSFLKYPNPNVYLNRAFSHEERESIVDKINSDKPIFQNMISNALCNFDIFYDAFGDNLRFIYILRNPAFVIYNMFMRGYGERIGVDPMEIQFSFEYKYDKTIPIYAKGWENEYDLSSPLDRIVHMVSDSQTNDFNGYKNLTQKQKKNVLFIDFDSFTNNPIPYYNKISRLINRNLLSSIDKVNVFKQDTNEILEYQQYIEKTCDKNQLQMFRQLLEEYNKFKKDLVIDYV